jgi:hypothetical protein
MSLSPLKQERIAKNTAQTVKFGQEHKRSNDPKPLEKNAGPRPSLELKTLAHQPQKETSRLK